MKNNIIKLINERFIKLRLYTLAKEIVTYFKNEFDINDFVIVAVLKGSFVFVSDLIREINKYNVDISIYFVGFKSYTGVKKVSDGVIIDCDNLELIENKSVLLVDDIFDTGRTIKRIEKHLYTFKPINIYKCCFLEKIGKNETDKTLDFRGFIVPDVFLIGYGLDLDERYRQLPYIAYVK